MIEEIEIKRKQYLLIRIISLFKSYFIKSGVDFNQLKKILEVKLIMDSRRSNISLQANNNDKSKEKNHMLGALFAYGFMGLLLSILSLAKMDIDLKLTVLFSFVMFMMTMVMITDFSNVLLDVRDNIVLYTKAIDRKVISIAKSIHILYYMTVYTLTLALPFTIGCVIKHGIYILPIILIALVLIDFLIVFITSILYTSVLKTFDGEKLKDVITFFQMALGIIMMLGYQLFNQTFRFINTELILSPKWYHIFFPPTWFASWAMNEQSLIVWILRVMALVIPVVCIYLYVNVLSKKFESYIMKLEASGEQVNKKSLDRKRRRREFIARIITKEGVERSSFLVSLLMLKKDRKLKVMILPTLALSAVLPIIVNLSFIFMESVEYVNIYFIYFSVLSGGLLSHFLTKSECYKGAWIYDSFPVDNYFEIYRGIHKAVVVLFLIPMMLLPSIFFMYFKGLGAIIEVLPAVFLLFIVSKFDFLFIAKLKPFSEEVTSVAANKGKVFVKTMLGLVFVALLFAVHLFLSKITFGVIGLIIAYIVILYIISESNILRKAYIK